MKLFWLALLIFYTWQQPDEKPIVSITEAGLKFTIPTKEWKPNPREVLGNIVLYNLKREPITDSLNRGIIANISILVEDIRPGTTVTAFSKMKRKEVDFGVDRIVTKDQGILAYPLSLGFEGHYVDQSKNEHKILVVHAVNGKKGIQMICDATPSVWPKVKDEFYAAVGSLTKTMKNNSRKL